VLKGILKYTTILLFSSNLAAQTTPWDLTSTVQRVLQEAPERQAAEAEVLSRQGAEKQADVWPNPTIELGFSNSLGKEDGAGGHDFDQFTISQPLPFLTGRLEGQRKQAQANLQQAQAQLAEQGLLLEYQASRVFHNLQLHLALYQLAQQQLEAANEFQRIGQRREQAGDLSRLARLRLDMVREAAKQSITSAEGKVSESLADFQTLVNMRHHNPQLIALDQPPALPNLAALEAQLENHSSLRAARQAVEAARYGVTIARANRFSDPEVWLSSERSFVGDRRQNVTALGVSVTVPLWDRGSGNIDSAQATRQKAQFEVNALQRNLGNRLRLNHLHLSHLIEQVNDYRHHVLEPANEIFQLTRKGFSSGQVEILNLVDAVDTYFNARGRYLELLQEAWLESAELRRSAGVSLFSTQPSTNEGAAQ